MADFVRADKGTWFGNWGNRGAIGTFFKKKRHGSYIGIKFNGGLPKVHLQIYQEHECQIS